MRSLLKKPLPAGYLYCILTIFVSFDAYACSCFPDMEFTKSLEKADSAFIGTHSGANRFLSLDTQRHKFRVDTIIKGATSDWVRIWSPKWTASCGIDTSKGAKYLVLVYQSQKSNKNYAYRCTTMPIELVWGNWKDIIAPYLEREEA